MPNTNVCATTSHWGESDSKRHNIAIARPETMEQRIERHFSQLVGHNGYELMRQHGFVSYSPYPKPD